MKAMCSKGGVSKSASAISPLLTVLAEFENRLKGTTGIGNKAVRMDFFLHFVLNWNDFNILLGLLSLSANHPLIFFRHGLFNPMSPVSGKVRLGPSSL